MQDCPGLHIRSAGTQLEVMAANALRSEGEHAEREAAGNAGP
jgi:hypothetical protein